MAMTCMRKIPHIFLLIAASFEGALLADASNSNLYREVGSLTANSSTDTNPVYARTVIRCAFLCSKENSCFGYTFDPTTAQCEFYRGCINIKSENDSSEKKSYAGTWKNLALGKNAIASGLSAHAPDIGVVTDGLWEDDYVRREANELADVFCTNDGDTGSERWIQFDLEKSFVICAVDIYDRAGPQPIRGDMLVTVNDDPQLISDRDQSECGIRPGLMSTGEWNLIACDRHKEGRHVRVQQLYSRGIFVQQCLYEVLIYGF